MKETMLVALAAAAIGGLAGASAVMFAGREESVSREPLDAQVLAAAFERAFAKSVGGLRDEVRALRTEISPARLEKAAVESPVAASEAIAPASSRRRRLEPATPDPTLPGENPAPNFERLREVEQWDDRPEVRRRWMFASERDAVVWFGAPDSVGTSDDGVETWYYEQELGDTDGDGETEEESFSLRFSRGRLIGP